MALEKGALVAKLKAALARSEAANCACNTKLNVVVTKLESKDKPESILHH